MRTRAWALVASLLLLSPVALAQWENEEKGRTRTASDSPGTAPTSLIAPTEDVGDDWETEEAEESFDDVEARRLGKRKNAAAQEDGQGSAPSPGATTDWTAAPARSGLTVIEENVSVSTTVEFGVEDADRIGRSLGASEQEGMSLGARRRQPEAKPFRIRADALDDTPAVTAPKAERSAPIGIVVPADQDFDDTPPSGRGGATRQRSLLDELSDSAGEYGGVRRSSGVGTGGSIRVTEERVDFQSPTTITVGEPEAAKPPTRSFIPTQAPPPRRVADEPVKPPEEPVKVVEPAPPVERPSRAVGKAAREPEKILSYDPFAKLEGELAEVEGRPAPAPAVDRPLPEYQLDQPRVQQLQAPVYEEPEMAVRPIEAPREADTSRDPSLVGLSALMGLGLNLATSPVTGFDTDFAWGFNVRVHPAFSGPVSLDLSFWRAARSDGTPVMTVDSAWNHVGVRVFYTKDYPKGLFLGFGGGLVVTGSSVEYLVNDGSLETSSASQFRPGGDVTAVMGLRFKPVEVRLDLRTIVRGGLRLDFLPVLSFGVSI